MSTAPPTDAPPTPPDPAPDVGRRSVYPRVFIPAAALIVGFIIFTWISDLNASTDEDGNRTTAAAEAYSSAFNWINDYLGWYYVVIVAGFIIFALVVGLSRYGDIKLGKDGEEPEFRLWTWLAMLFAAGMGIGLVFWGAAEPLSHFASPRPGWEGEPNEIAQQAMLQTYLHWGLHAWGIYVIVGLAIAYAVFRKGRPVSIRWALEPVLGKYVRGWLGDVVDIIAIVGTLFGIATSLGLGALQISEGMNFLGWIDVPEGEEPSAFVLIMLISAITLVAVLSVVTGIKRGIKWLSQINVTLAGLLLVFVLLSGGLFVVLLQDFIQSTGSYLQNLPRLSFDVGAAEGDEGRAWAGAWTTFYWGWWISWAAFVGIFIARISRGRTVREFVIGVLLAPTAVSFLWFTVMGGSALHNELDPDTANIIGEDGSVTQEGALFGLLDTLPAGTFLIIGTLLLIAIFFITSSDSGSLVVDMLASGGDPEPPTWSRVFWALMEGLVAIVLLTAISGASGLLSLRTASIVAALPVSIVMIAMCVAIWKQFRGERQAMEHAERKQQTQELTDSVTKSMIDEGLIEPNGGDQAAAGRGARAPAGD